MTDNAYSVPVFGSAAQAPVPASALAAAALPATPAGIVGLGSDYSATAKAQLPKVDASGNQYIIPNAAGGNPGTYQANVAVASVSAVSGGVALGMYGLVPTPMALDCNTGLQIVNTPKTTFRAIATSVTCATNKALLSISNASSLMVRLAHVFILVPGSGVNSLLGTGTVTYYPLYCELWRVPTPTLGTSLSLVPSDSAQTANSGITALSAPTVGTKTALLHRRDALPASNSNGLWYQVQCNTEQNIVIRPGESLAVVCVSNGTINGPSGATTTAVVDVTAVFTQAVA